jgi:hypothetical protein
MTNSYQNLSEPFPQEMVRSLNKGGASLVYIPVSEVITRMNKVLGVENWDKIDGPWQQVGNSIVAQVTVMATIDGKQVRRDGVGGQKIKMSKQGEPVDIGDEIKGAYSDALKKAVQTLGVGLYLARTDDAIEIEQVMEAVPANADAQPIWENFIGISKKFNAEQKAELRSKWSDWSNGKSVPTKDTVTVEEAEFLHVEAVAIAFSEKKKD